MEEQKIPSRSDRHKKKKGFLPAGNPEHNKSEKTEAFHAEDMTPSINQAESVNEEESKTEIAHKESADAVHSTIQELLAELEEKKSAEDALTENNIQQPDTHTEIASEAETVVPPVHKKKKKHRNLNPAAGFLLLFIMLVSGAWCGYAAMNAVLPHNDTYMGDARDQEMLDNINLLLLGCDEREGDSAARADVIMVGTIRPEEKQVSIFSIPRDTRVSIKGHGKDKINHAMAYGGIPLVQSSVEELLGIQIDHTVKVNFDGFINVIDALDGINIEVPCRMYKPLEAIDLLPGYQTLDGSEALAFVRWRGDGTGDYGRIERQQQFLSAVTEKVKDMSLTQALDVAGAVMDSIETDMSIRQMTSYGINLLGISSENIKTYSFIGEAVWINGVNYVEPDMAAIHDIVDKMQHGEPEPEPQVEGTADVDTENV